MLGFVLGALRPTLALVIAGGVATVAVAPALDMAQQRAASQALAAAAAPVRHDSKQDFERLLRRCLETRDLDSSECLEAAVASDLSFEDFRAKVVALLEPTPKPETTSKTEPAKTPDPSTQPMKKPAALEFEIVFKKCVDSRDRRSDPCESAYQLSGMSSDDFDAKVQAKIDAATLPADQLRAKLDAKLATVAPKDGGDFWAWFEKCLVTRDLRSDACFRAQQLIGFSDADFKAKFERYLADRDAKLGRSTAQPVASLDAIFKACGETHSWGSTACLEAYVRSGMQTAEFRTKLTATFGAFH
jgi:hypothetical protein